MRFILCFHLRCGDGKVPPGRSTGRGLATSWLVGRRGAGWCLVAPKHWGGGVPTERAMEPCGQLKKKQLLPDPSRDKPNAKNRPGKMQVRRLESNLPLMSRCELGRAFPTEKAPPTCPCQPSAKSFPMRRKGIQRGKRAVGRSGWSLFGHSALGGPRRRLLPRAELHLDVHVEGGRPGGRRLGVRPLPTRCSRFPRGL